ncbi:hypothetical protein Trydic_g15241 [Trypoxylus dichotomus]
MLLYSAPDEDSSNHHPRQKNVVVSTLVEGARRVCSKKQLHKVLDHLRQALWYNGYPENIINRAITSNPRSRDKNDRETNVGHSILAIHKQHYGGQDRTNIELLAESLQSAIITSYEASCPVKIRSTNRDTPSWTRELSELRTATRKLYKCKKSGSWDEYKASLTRYNRALRKAKRDSWKKFRQELETVPECSRIRKVLAREKPSRIGTLSKSDGTKAETEEQVLQHLLEVHFPGSEIIQTQFGGECKGLSSQIPDGE